MLVYAGTKQELTVKDNAGFTPVQIASDKGHQRVALFLVRNFIFVALLVAFSSPNLTGLETQIWEYEVEFGRRF